MFILTINGNKEHIKKLIMKKLALFISVLFVASLAFSQQEEKVKETIDQSSNGPQISFDKVVHDYGTIYKGADGNCDFEFTNTGNEPLVLSTVRSSCGCTVPKWPREPILPGKKGVINVRYDTRRMGTINKSITVMSNAKTSSVVLSIKGKIIPEPAETMPEKAPATGVKKDAE